MARLGQRRTTDHFVVLLVQSDPKRREDSPRLGVTVSRRVGSAVVRNRVKRGIREWFRRTQVSQHLRGDIVVIARQGASKLGTQEISQELSEVLR